MNYRAHVSDEWFNKKYSLKNPIICLEDGAFLISVRWRIWPTLNFLLLKYTI